MSSSINKAELIGKLQTLEGLTNEERSNLIGLLRQHKKYGLVWEDKPEDVEERLREELPILREVKDKAILSDVPDAPNHILIEGDNLEVLTALSYTHEGKIDVIYIDPPYNTGNKDFVYNDSFVDSEDSYRHSKWLSFMNKRLKIAKKLLSDKGVIFISIDDNEQAQLKLLCHEIWGEKNFQGHIHWRRRHNQPNDKTKMIGLVAEHILVYSKYHLPPLLQIQTTTQEDLGQANLGKQVQTKEEALIRLFHQKEMSFVTNGWETRIHLINFWRTKESISLITDMGSQEKNTIKVKERKKDNVHVTGGLTNNLGIIKGQTIY